MREQFNRDLTELRQELISVYTDVDLELHAAVDALVLDDKACAKSAKNATRSIDERCAMLENRAYALLALQQPVASDLRLLQFIVYVSFNLARMSNHTRNIAKAARRRHGVVIPSRLLILLKNQALLVYRVLGATAKAIVEGNLALAVQTPELDEPVDELYRQFFEVFKSLDPAKDDIEAAMGVMMAARMLERISDNSVEVAGRLVFLLTGKRISLGELGALNCDAMQHLYAARGPALTADRGVDVSLAAQIPEVELSGAEGAEPGAEFE